MMRNSASRALPLVMVLLLLASGAVFAGENAGAKFSASPPGLVEIGPGQEVTVELEADNVVGVKQYGLVVTLDPPDAFDLDSITFATASDVLDPEDPKTWVSGTWISPGVLLLDDGVELGAGNFTDAYTGSDFALGTLTLTTAADFTADTEALIDVTRISLGPSSTERDVFEIDDLTSVVVRLNSFILGDPTGDLKITVADALRTLRIAVGAIADPTAVELAAADVNGVAGVSVGDALRILRFAVGVPGIILEPPQ